MLFKKSKILILTSDKSKHMIAKDKAEAVVSDFVQTPS